MGNSQEPQDFNISVMPSSLTPVHVAKAAEGLNLYDTASHQVSHFVPLKPGEVGIYVCGATVQSSPHIGHIRAAVAFDIVRRWFLKLGYKVTFVRNVTDIDDKILVKAAAAGQRWWARAYYYEREFTEAYNTLGVLPPTVEPRATGHMSDMIDLIQRILDNGHGYVVTDADGKPTGNVYFDVASWPHYGELTHQKQTSEVDEAAAVADRMGPSVDATGADKYNPVDPADASPDKHDPRDFALWKAPKDTDPEDARWSTPFGVGRPGWHIECSAMAQDLLGNTFDIHGGGPDLIFPHHENEIAQSEGANGVPFAKVWMHSGPLRVRMADGSEVKMSKSLGNFWTIRDALKETNAAYGEKNGAEVLRFFLMRSHYRSPVTFGPSLIEDAQKALVRLYGALKGREAAPGPVDWTEAHAARFKEAMDDDFNTPQAVGVLFDLALEVNRTGSPELVRQLRGLGAVLNVLQLDPESFLKGAVTEGDEARIEALIAERAAAKKARNFARADEIRDQLKNESIELLDGPQGTTWRRIG